MKIIRTSIPDLLVIEPIVYKDQRGYFYEVYNEARFFEQGIKAKFIQDNESKSNKGTIRGLHYQLDPHAQTKLVRVIEGIVYDVAVDLRAGSPTFGQWHGEILTADNKKQFYIPRGFAHGFSVLSESAVFAYKCDNLYNKEAERGIRFNDETLNIDWKIAHDLALVSEKDLQQPAFSDAEYNFVF
ncbi:dTDP-4-dehydrorhamnose 3,5-epimerase [Roseimarinus sediminis]|jgi:dTDP-4-dehydrorhamnose 3,5-epimerase|uniref:dTDP-4-dehydrorhamnose 3,5-epimerase n=1 Tax=Roseimarinus sediminis TaxID=1610899 RepID=UPI003D261FF7